MNFKNQIKISGLTDIGSVRDHNEDAIGAVSRIGLLVIADGMGGHLAGEMASAIAVSTIIDDITKKLTETKPRESCDITGYSLESAIVHDAVALANRNVHSASVNNDKYRGMGTTVVVALFYDDRLTVAHVGDSRLYRFRDNVIKPVTLDHSLMQELIERGFYTPQEARNSSNKNLVTRAIGIDKSVEIDVQEEIVMTNDVYLLCSDGVNDMLEDEIIQKIIQENFGDLKAAAAAIVQAANDAGGKDNISALLAQPVKPFPAKNGFLSKLTNLFS